MMVPDILTVTTFPDQNEKFSVWFSGLYHCSVDQNDNLTFCFILHFCNFPEQHRPILHYRHIFTVSFVVSVFRRPSNSSSMSSCAFLLRPSRFSGLFRLLCNKHWKGVHRCSPVVIVSMKDISELQRYIGTYFKTRKVYAQYRKLTGRKQTKF